MRKHQLFCLLVLSFSFHINAYTEIPDFQIVTEELPPFNFTKNNEVTGTSTRVVNLVLKRLDIDAKIQVLPWARAYLIARKKRNVLIFSIGRTQSREKLFKWVGEIAPMKYYFFALSTRKDIKIDTLDDAKKYIMGTVVDGMGEGYLLNNGFVKEQNLVSTVGLKSNFEMLLKGRIELWESPEAVAYNFVESLNYPHDIIKKAHYISELSSQGLQMAFSLDTDDAIVERFKRALKEIKDNGSYSEIYPNEVH